jgi:regulator of cell morphogenesis and NO signaling
MTTTDTPLGDIVATNPGAARVLDRLGLDYCCHGERTLADACAAAGLDAAAVVEELAAAPAGEDTTWTTLGPAELADHVVATHHRYLWSELPALEALADKVATVHGGRHAELADVASLVHAVRAELEAHLRTEEEELFPAIRALAADGEEAAAAKVEDQVEELAAEHDTAGERLAELRAVTANYEVPADGCASYRSLYERLEELEHDTHRHVHKENHTLFPAAAALAASRSGE